MADETPPATIANDNAPAQRCPVCGKATVREFRPFCSRRCSDVDLHRWLSGAYVVPAAEDADDTASASEEPGARE